MSQSASEETVYLSRRKTFSKRFVLRPESIEKSVEGFRAGFPFFRRDVVSDGLRVAKKCKGRENPLFPRVSARIIN